MIETEIKICDICKESKAKKVCCICKKDLCNNINCSRTLKIELIFNEAKFPDSKLCLCNLIESVCPDCQKYLLRKNDWKDLKGIVSLFIDQLKKERLADSI